MVCIYCAHETKVINSRHQKRQNNVWRRRSCQDCHAVFTTIEQVDTQQAVLVQTATAKQAYNRDKHLISIYECLKHRDDAISDATALQQTVWGQLLPLISNAVILREHIVEMTATALEHFDHTAGVLYRAYHR